MGLNVFAGLFLIGFVISAVFIFFIKTLSTLDIFLPIPIAVVWTIVLFPLKISIDLISPATMVLSAFLLTYSLWIYKLKGMSKNWIVLPVLMFLYEMLPVNFPGPFDDAFAAAGSAGNALLLSIVALRSRSFGGFQKTIEIAPATVVLKQNHATKAIETGGEANQSSTAGVPSDTSFDSEATQDVSPVRTIDGSLGDEVRSLASAVVKMAWEKPKIKQAVIEKSKAIAEDLNLSKGEGL